jgi:hypothetical protein
MTGGSLRNDGGSPVIDLSEVFQIVGVEYLGFPWELAIPTIVGIEYSIPGGS